ncbi:MAG TPA: hypothetical protein VEN79_17385 [Terriglobia bacterium]|nr:hypothetical protein [Terriglobia bacterium]
MADLSPQERLRQRADLAVTVSSRTEIESFFNETAKDVLLGLARNPHLQERDLLRLLERKDLAHEVVQEIAQHKAVRRSYAVQLALVRHPKSPRHVSLPLMKFLYIFDLLRVAQTPAVPADVKMVAEEAILKKLAGMPRGQRTSLARRGTGRLAASLLVDSDKELIRAALDNPYLTEGLLLKVLAREGLPPAVADHIAQHPRWSHHYHLRLALIRNPLTPLARVLAFLPDMAVTDLRDICLDHRMPREIRKYIEAHCAARLKKQ